MKFRCERDVLVEALASATRAVTTRGGTLPVLSGVKAALAGDRLLLTGTDLDLTIQVVVTVAGGTDGAAVLPARLAADIVRALDPGAVYVEVHETEARIASGRSHFSVRLLPTEDFPRVADTPADEVTLDAAALVDALRQVVPAASHDDARPILTGVLMAAEGDGLRLVATDSYRLAVRDLPGASVLREGQSVLVPSRALGELARLLGGADKGGAGTVSLRLGERDATFEVGAFAGGAAAGGDAGDPGAVGAMATRLTTRLIEGQFPNYRQLVPEHHPNRLTVGREPLLDALRRVKLLAREAIPVRLQLRPGTVQLSAVTQDVGQAEEELDAKYEGAEMGISFNPEYLVDGVEAVAGDEVTLETLDGLKPAVVRAVGRDDYLYLLMPIRVS
ncbi:MAG: DNA polymerase III subunit beta [Actinomycetota bacterium]|nr:DNA polymerase III subunit beta [Actinomycetota bacterium]MDP8954769.1 DNA polymerase III subunit beta [Actinomycetota bacterium]